MLCALEPVKYSQAAPKLAGGTLRRSTCRPLRSTTLARVGPLARTLPHIGTAGEALHHRAAALGRDQQVQVAHGLAHAAQAAGRDGLPHAGHARQLGQQRIGHLGRHAPA